jgi:hypothetical protein
LAEHQELNVLGPRRPAGKKSQPEELTADESDESDKHFESLADASAGIFEQTPFDGCAWSAGGRRHDTLYDHRLHNGLSNAVLPRVGISPS